ncbi:hypothetical protein DYB28_011334, partial [Aphanomyces astaci]
MVREEAEKAQRRQLAVEQWTLAKRHHLRALDNVSIFRTKAIKAKHWHHDTTLHQRFGAWVGYRDACRAQARAIRTARLRAAATWHDKRWLHRVMLQWQAVWEATVQRELSVRTASHNHLVRRLWGVVKSLTDARKAQLCRLQVKREADAKRRVLHVWSCRVGVRRKEAAAKREKDMMWRQVPSIDGTIMVGMSNADKWEAVGHPVVKKLHAALSKQEAYILATNSNTNRSGNLQSHPQLLRAVELEDLLVKKINVWVGEKKSRDFINDPTAMAEYLRVASC